MTVLGGGIDELEGDVLSGSAGSLGQERLTEGQRTTLGTDDTALNHEPVLVDNTVMGETTEGGDVLLSQIVLSGGTVLVLTVSLTDAVDLLVDLGTVMVTVLTGTGDLELDAGRMPSTDTGNLTETTMGLTGQAGNTPTSDDTVNTATLGNTDDIDHLVLLEDGVNLDFLLEQALAEVDLIGDGATVNLDLLNVSLQLTDLDLGHLGVADQTDDLAVILGALDLGGHLVVGLVLSQVLGESFLLGLVPVLVEATLELIGQGTSPDGGQGTETTRSFNVTDETASNHGRALEDGDGLDAVLLVNLGTRLVNVTDDMGHTGLVTHETGEVALLGGIILGERFDLTEVMFGTLLGQETQRTVTGAFELTMRHLEKSR